MSVDPAASYLLENPLWLRKWCEVHSVARIPQNHVRIDARRQRPDRLPIFRFALAHATTAGAMMAWVIDSAAPVMIS